MLPKGARHITLPHGGRPQVSNGLGGFCQPGKLLSRSAMLNFQLAQQAEQLFASHARQFLADNNPTTLLVGGITVIVMTGGRGDDGSRMELSINENHSHCNARFMAKSSNFSPGPKSCYPRSECGRGSGSVFHHSRTNGRNSAI